MPCYCYKFTTQKSSQGKIAVVCTFRDIGRRIFDTVIIKNENMSTAERCKMKIRNKYLKDFVI